MYELCLVLGRRPLSNRKLFRYKGHLGLRIWSNGYRNLGTWIRTSQVYQYTWDRPYGPPRNWVCGWLFRTRTSYIVGISNREYTSYLVDIRYNRDSSVALPLRTLGSLILATFEIGEDNWE